MVDESINIPPGMSPKDFAASELEKKWSTNGFEWVAVYLLNAPTQLLLCSDQKGGSSGLSPAVDSLLRAAPSVLHHNHPTSHPLSPSDYINFQAYPLLQEMWVHGHDRISWYHLTLSKRLPNHHIGDGAETRIEDFATVIGAFGDHAQVAFRHGFAKAVEQLTGGTYNYVLPIAYQQAARSMIELRYVENCVRLVTEAYYNLTGDPVLSQSTTAVNDAGVCIDAALRAGTYAMPLPQPLQAVGTLFPFYAAHCLALEKWIKATFP